MVVPRSAAAAPPPTAPALRVQEVVVVFKTHFDIGYTDMASNIVRRYRTTMIDDALRVVDDGRGLPPEQQFAWTLPGWPLHKILEDWPGQTAERRQRLEQALRQGRFVVHALPFTTHTELLELEDLVHGLGYSAGLTRRLGLDLPRDAKMTDVPSHSWVLPTLLRHAGVDFLHLGCNPASSSPQVPPLFWWEGPDGSRLLTFYSPAGYGSGLVPPADWPYPVWLALIHTGDNHGPPRPDEVRQLLTEANEKLPGVRVRIGRLSDFAEALLATKPHIPVVRGDMPDTWIHGPMCDPAGARIARNLRPALGVAERLHTQFQAWGVPVTDPTPTLQAAREQSLLYGEHTWGGALSWVTQYSRNTPFWHGEAFREERAAGRFQKIEASWAEHSAYAENLRQLTAPLVPNALETLARAVNVPGERIVVFNPLPWKRDGWVSLPVACRAEAVEAVDDGAILPVGAVAGTTGFVARDLPPSGYRTYRFVAAKPRPDGVRVDESGCAIESPYFRAVLDPQRGAIGSLIERRTKREWVDASAEFGFGQYLYERFGSAEVAAYVKDYVKIGVDWAITELGKPGLPPPAEAPYAAARPSGGAVSFESSAAAVTAVMRCGPGPNLPHAVTTRLTLYADLPCVDLEITVHDKAADPWPEAGWICLPFRMQAPQFRLGRLGGIVDPARDLVPGANRDLGAVQTGVALWDGDGGVGVCPLDSPLVSLDRPGLWRYSREFTPRRPNVFINLFNNQWSTNFRLWNSGTWTSRVRLWGFRKFAGDIALATPALEARQSLEAGYADAAAGTLPPVQRGIELSRAGVAVTAFGPNPDGAGTILQLWELGGRSGRVTVRLPSGMSASAVQPVNLRGQPVGQPIPVRQGRYSTALRAYAPVAFHW